MIPSPCAPTSNDVCGVAIWSQLESIREITHGYALPMPDSPEVFVFTGQDWAELFRAFVANLSLQHRRHILATEYTGDHRIVPWNSVGVETMAKRVDTPWLPGILRNGEMLTHFQPIADVQHGEIHGYEALARAVVDDHTKNGGEILDAARAHDALRDFDDKARLTALDAASVNLRWHERLFVNILPSTFVDPYHDLNHFWAAAEEWGVAPQRVVLEILESDEMPDREALLELVYGIRLRGGLIALDDVGAGHSSLIHIQELKPDLVKFDRGLLPIAPSDAAVALLVGLNEYAHSHGCLTVAEGVETEQQMEIVRYCRFDLAQGWLIGKPKAPPVARTLRN